jgi:hypothetical protein
VSRVNFLFSLPRPEHPKHNVEGRNTPKKRAAAPTTTQLMGAPVGARNIRNIVAKHYNKATAESIARTVLDGSASVLAA